MTKSGILGLRTTIYKVPDMVQAKEWYAKAFGTNPYWEGDAYTGFNIGGYELGLHLEEHPTTDKPDTVLSYWGVENLHDHHGRLLALGATEHEPPTNVGGEIELSSVKDPWGNVIGLIYNPEFSIADTSEG
ncbi:MAG: VOC family protein [Bacteroidia bacterium]|nr:VOC family protein [Bacteroidia bacterium]